MKIYVLVETCESFSNSFKVLDVFADKEKANQEADRLRRENNPPDDDPEDPRQYSYLYTVEEREVIQ